MAVIEGPQDIPSAWLQDAQDLGIPVRADNRVQPFPWHRYLGPFSDRQLLTWETFWKATKIWWMQPWFDGVTPPAIGPRSRTWWYDVGWDFSVGYYNYFMYLTLLLLYIDVLPEWAQEWVIEESFTVSLYPNAIRGAWDSLQVGKYRGDGLFSLQRSYIKTPGWYPKTLYLWCSGVWVLGIPQQKIEVCNVDPDAWTEDTLKWNNQPELGSVITVIEPPFTPNAFLKIDIGKAEAVCVKLWAETFPPPDTYFMLYFNSHEYEEIWKRPYQGMTI